MKKLTLLLLMILLLAACNGGPAGGPTLPEAADDPDEEAGLQLASELAVFNWANYIDEDILADYEREYGVRIIYDTFASNEDLLAKLQAGAVGYDVIFPSDYMVEQMRELGLLAELDKSLIPNLANVDDAFLDPPFDPGNRYCMPYQWGTTGLAYRNGHPFFSQNPPDSWAYIFEPELLEQYADGGIHVLDDQREVMAAALAYLGYSVNETDESRLEEARDLILRARPYWRVFSTSDYDYTLLIPDEVVLSLAWSGEAANAYWHTYDEELDDGNWYYVIPQEGGVIWVDNMCVTASSQRQETAMHFINYLLDGEVGAAITNFTYYASPNAAAKPFIEAEILEDPGIYPPDEVMAKLDWLVDVGDAIFIYDRIWTQIKGGG